MQERSMDDNVASLRDRLLLAPQDTGAMVDLARLLEAAGDHPAGIDLYQRALRVDPYQIAIILALARAWSTLGDTGRARSWFARALAIDPDCAEAAGAISGLADADQLTPAYIRTLFDQYAPRFDDDLTGTLHYRAPQLVAAAIVRQGLAVRSADILDLGCGTGLSGSALLPFARRLDGVDLSPRMVEQARKRGIYDTLAVGDAQEFLSAANRTWDLIAAVDMLNYLGDLMPVLAAAAACLNPGGLLAGTVEKGEGGVVLTAKRRYVHGADHLHASLAAAGLTLLDMTEAELRIEGGEPVAGLVFVAGRRK